MFLLPQKQCFEILAKHLLLLSWKQSFEILGKNIRFAIFGIKQVPIMSTSKLQQILVI